MSYITYEKYLQHIYDTGSPLAEAKFQALEKQAERCLNNFTMTVDGVKKLVDYFPEAEDDVEAVEAAMAALINALDGFGAYQTAAMQALSQGNGGVIASKSSGSESISYAVAGDGLVSAAQTPSQKNAYLYQLAREYLEGAKDKNGVNLLYGGVYPYVC